MMSYLLHYKADNYIEIFKDIVQKYKSKGKIIVSTNASYMQFSDKGDEIYGIHFLVEFFKGRDEYILIVSDPSGQYSDYYREEKLKNVCIIKQKHSYASLLSYSDIMIRATATDGDSLSVREALDLGVRVIATDCVDRPVGVLLFKYNDEQFERVIEIYKRSILLFPLLANHETGGIVASLINSEASHSFQESLSSPK